MSRGARRNAPYSTSFFKSFLEKIRKFSISLPPSPLTKIWLRILNRRFSQVVDLKTISSRTLELSPRNEFSVVPPTLAGEKPHNHHSTYTSEVFSFEFKDAIISPYSDNVVVGGKIGLNSRKFQGVGRILSSEGKLSEYSSSYAICPLKADHFVENGILIGGDGAFNWFHFVLECCPKVTASELLPPEYDSFPLIAPDVALENDNFREILSAITKNRNVKYFGRETIFVRKLVSFSPILFSPFNLGNHQSLRLSDYYFHWPLLDKYIRDLKSHLLHRNSTVSNNHPKKIYICRAKNRRDYNQENLLQIANEFGYVGIFPEEMTLEEQCSIFSNASHIIGSSGSAWVNLIFMNQYSKALAWIPNNLENFALWSTISHRLGVPLRFLTYDLPSSSTSEVSISEYNLDEGQFRDALIDLE